jgi:hypothetical protein
MRRRKLEHLKRVPLRTQRGVLCDVMLSARDCGAWLTLEELARLTHYPPASISAQLRHLRKPQYGAFVVEKRRREYEEVGRIEEQGAVWEYRLEKGTRCEIRRSWLTGAGPGACAQEVAQFSSPVDDAEFASVL